MRYKSIEFRIYAYVQFKIFLMCYQNVNKNNESFLLSINGSPKTTISFMKIDNDKKGSNCCKKVAIKFENWHKYCSQNRGAA